MDPVIPPTPHHPLPGHELFDLVAKRDIHQLRATSECPFLNRPDGGGYADVYEGPASVKCPLPNLLQPIAENRGRQP